MKTLFRDISFVKGMQVELKIYGDLSPGFYFNEYENEWYFVLITMNPLEEESNMYYFAALKNEISVFTESSNFKINDFCAKGDKFYKAVQLSTLLKEL